MKANTTLQKVLALLLTVTVSSGGLTLEGKAATVEASVYQQVVTENGVEHDLESQVDGKAVIRELEEERTENSNTYLLEDGSKKLVMYAEDVRYPSENGGYTDYNPELTPVDSEDAEVVADAVVEGLVSETEPEDYQYRNTEGDSMQYLPVTAGTDTPVLMTKAGYGLSFAPYTDGENHAFSGDSYEKSAVYKEAISDAYEQERLGKTAMLYANGDNSIKLRYDSMSNGIKETVTLKKQPESGSFLFLLRTKDMEAKLDHTGKSITFLDPETEQIVGGISSAFMNDATGAAYSEDITYSLTEQPASTAAEGVHTYLFAMEVSEAYLSDPARMYPVTIDPTATWAGSDKVQDTYVLKAQPAYNYYASGIDTFSVGNGSQGLFRTYMKIVGFGTAIDGKSVESAKLTVYENGNNAKGTVIQAKQVTETFAMNKITWNNKPANGAKVYASITSSGTSGTAKTFNLTTWARGMADGSLEKKGLVLMASNESTASTYVRFYGSRTADTTKRPKMVATYYDKPTAPTDATVSKAYLRAGDSLTVTWSGISSTALSHVQYRVANYNPETQKNTATYIDYSTSTKLGTAGSGSKQIVSSMNWPEGVYRIHIRGVDKNGIAGASKGKIVYVDKTVPVINSVSLSPATTVSAYSKTAPTIKWEVTDVNLSQVQVSINGGAYISIGTTSTGNKVLEGLISEKANSIKVRAVDKAGNISEVKTLMYYYDNTAPRINSVTVSPATTGDIYSGSETPVLAWSVTDGTLKEVYYRINNGGYISLGCQAQGSRALNLTGGSGTYSISIKAVDKAGNSREISANQYHYDNEAPMVSKLLAGKNPGSHTLVVSLYDLEDNASGVDTTNIRYTLTDTATGERAIGGTAENVEVSDGSTVFTVDDSSLKDGIYKLSVSVADRAGNTRTYNRAWYRFDDAVYDGTLLLNGEYNETDGTIALTWGDEEVESETEQDEVESGEMVQSYMLYAAYGDGIYEKFADYNAQTISQNIVIWNHNENVSFRLFAVYGDGSQRLSNIISAVHQEPETDLETEEEEESESEEVDSETIYNTHGVMQLDSDEDGLEDGYEVWDFGSDPNASDSDGDGFDDYYEVVVLGTNPAVYTADSDSDGDGLTNLEEYEKGTNPYLLDTDFDGYSDKEDIEPLKTDPEGADSADLSVEVHKGIYDKKSEIAEGKIVLYNMYSHKTHSMLETTGNKTKYFYDKKGNTIAIVTCSAEGNKANVYEYGTDNNVISMFQNGSLYEFLYDEEGNVLQITMGEISLFEHQREVIEDNMEALLNVGDMELNVKQKTYYANGQYITEVFRKYKTVSVSEDFAESEIEPTEVQVQKDIYYNAENTPRYSIQYNANGNILKLVDYSTKQGVPVTYNYEYTGDQTKISTADDSFSISFSKKSESAEDNINQITEEDVTLEFQDCRGYHVCRATKTTKTENTEAKGSNIIVESQFSNGYKALLNTGAGDSASIFEVRKQDDNTVILGNSTMIIDELNSNQKLQNYSLKYRYDEKGNIIAINKQGNEKEELVAAYEYDSQSQLIQEDNREAGVKKVFQYDKYGNIKNIETFIYQPGTAMQLSQSINLDYSSTCKEQVQSVNQNHITYDKQGNPIRYYNGMEFGWDNGRMLSTLQNGSWITQYAYNNEGIRTGKIQGDKKTTYDIYDSRILHEKIVDDDKVQDIWYLYNGMNEVIGFELIDRDGEHVYFYEKNLQEDIIAIYSDDGKQVVTYTYDAWGNLLEMKGEQASTIGQLNAFRYHSYYYDKESGFYYLQSRYYDPNIGRFLNADDPIMLIPDNSLLSLDTGNLYQYCGNNPVNRQDKSGHWYYNLQDYYNREVSFYYTVYVQAKWYKKPFWRKKYKKVYKYYNEIMEKYAYNKKCMGSYRGYIEDQRAYGRIKDEKGKDYFVRIKEMKYGNEIIGNVGCELVAVYNAMKEGGHFQDFASIILEFELNDLTWLGGTFGTKASNISKYLTTHGIHYGAYSMISKKKFFQNAARLLRGKVHIVSYFNGKASTGKGKYMIHTVTFHYDWDSKKVKPENGRYKIYNQSGGITYQNFADKILSKDNVFQYGYSLYF